MPTLEEIRAEARARCAGDFPGKIHAHYPFWDTQYRPYLLAAIDRFPAEHLDFKPRPELLTARQMIVHIAEAERAWIDSVIDGNPEEEWVSPADDAAQGWRLVIDAPDHAALHALLDECHQPTRRWFDRPASDLGHQVHRTLPDGSVRTYTVHWILDHVQEHEIHHRAQLNLYLRLLAIEPPSI